MLTPKSAASKLFDMLHNEPWFVSVGIGEENHRSILYLYVTNPKKVRVPSIVDGSLGYSIRVVKMDHPKPAAA